MRRNGQSHVVRFYAANSLIIGKYRFIGGSVPIRKGFDPVGEDVAHQKEKLGLWP